MSYWSSYFCSDNEDFKRLWDSLRNRRKSDHRKYTWLLISHWTNGQGTPKTQRSRHKHFKSPFSYFPFHHPEVWTRFAIMRNETWWGTRWFRRLSWADNSYGKKKNTLNLNRSKLHEGSTMMSACLLVFLLVSSRVWMQSLNAKPKEGLQGISLCCHNILSILPFGGQ